MAMSNTDRAPGLKRFKYIKAKTSRSDGWKREEKRGKKEEKAIKEWRRKKKYKNGK